MNHQIGTMLRTYAPRWAGGIVAFVSVVSLALGTSPLPPPYHRYAISGTIRHTDGTPAANVIMVAFTRTGRDTAMQMSHDTGVTDHRPLGVSYSDGRYSLSVRTEVIAESLAIGCVAPGRSMVYTPAFHPDPSLAFETRGMGTSTTDPGCSGCGAEPSRYEYTVAFTTSISRDLEVD